MGFLPLVRFADKVHAFEGATRLFLENLCAPPGTTDRSVAAGSMQWPFSFYRAKQKMVMFRFCGGTMFQVLLLPLNGLRSFEVPDEIPNAERSRRSSATGCAGSHRRDAQVELPQLRVLDLSFNELCTLDGFWSAPRLQQLCLVANHLLLLSDLAPVGPLNPKR